VKAGRFWRGWTTSTSKPLEGGGSPVWNRHREQTRVQLKQASQSSACHQNWPKQHIGRIRLDLAERTQIIAAHPRNRNSMSPSRSGRWRGGSSRWMT